MPEVFVFTDSSLNPQTHVAYGAYLVIAEPDLDGDALQPRMKLGRFEKTSSTKIELQTLLLALSEIQSPGSRLKVFTDSQNIMGLPDRRDHLERNGFRSKQGALLNNHELYREFYRLIDRLDCEWFKVCGHQPSKQKGDMEQIFALVERASRKALREEVRRNKNNQ
jgi:ribonuclease HI